MSTATQAKSFFLFEADGRAFNESLTRLMAEFQKKYMSNFILPQNTYRLSHGRTWTNPANSEAGSGEMKIHSAYMQTRFDEIIANDLSILQRSFQEISEALQQQFAGSFYSTLSEACDASGNVIRAPREGSFPNSFLAMLEKIEFSVDKDGNVHMPQIHAHPETAQQMLAELEASPPEFREKVDQIKQKKILAAHEHEAARKAKFARYGE